MIPSKTRLDLRATRVLVVDDNPQSLELTTQILQGFRIERTSAARSAQQARDLLEDQVFDLILIDGEMPGEDGIALARHIRLQTDQPNFTAPIIVMSSHTPIEKVHRARDAGANLVVKKPVDPAALLARITWLARSTREFVTTPDYAGPDRRFRSDLPPEDTGERRADRLALQSKDAMDQDDIDALFG